MKKFLYLLLLFCFFQKAAAQDLTCLTCDSITRYSGKYTTTADAYWLLSRSTNGFNYEGISILGQCNRANNGVALNRALTDEEIELFVTQYGKDYLLESGQNYFLNIDYGHYYFAVVNRDGSVSQKIDINAVLPDNVIAFYLKKNIPEP